MNNWMNYRIRTWHLGMAFVLLALIANVIGAWEVGDYSQKTENIFYTELDEVTFKESELSNISFILFYNDRSELSSKTEFNLGELQKISENNVSFYKLNVNECTRVQNEYNISGTPCILVFNEGREVDRIMGVTSVDNLKKVYKRVTR